MNNKTVILNNNKQYNQYFKIGNEEKLTPLELFFAKEIKKTIINHFEKVKLKFDFEYRTILNGNLKNPMFSPKTLNPTLEEELIILCVNNYSYFSQLIYQLSHELTHCFIYCNNKDEGKKIKWIEETICEAMSLYFLKYFLQNWNKLALGKINPNYSKSIEMYLNDILKKDGTNKLSNCNNIQDLMIINEKSETNREDRFNEMKILYNLIDESSIKGLIKYKDFINDEKLLNTQKYIDNNPSNNAVKYICSIQDKIQHKTK